MDDLYTYTVGPNPERGPRSGDVLRDGIIPVRTVYARRSATAPDSDHEIMVYSTQDRDCSDLGYVDVVHLFGGDMPELPAPVVEVVTILAYEAAALALGVDGELPLWRLIGDGADINRLLDLAKAIQKEISSCSRR